MPERRRSRWLAVGVSTAVAVVLAGAVPAVPGAQPPPPGSVGATTTTETTSTSTRTTTDLSTTTETTGTGDATSTTTRTSTPGTSTTEPATTTEASATTRSGSVVGADPSSDGSDVAVLAVAGVLFLVALAAVVMLQHRRTGGGTPLPAAGDAPPEGDIL